MQVQCVMGYDDGGEEVESIVDGSMYVIYIAIDRVRLDWMTVADLPSHSPHSIGPSNGKEWNVRERTSATIMLCMWQCGVVSQTAVAAIISQSNHYAYYP